MSVKTAHSVWTEQNLIELWVHMRVEREQWLYKVGRAQLDSLSTACHSGAEKQNMCQECFPLCAPPLLFVTASIYFHWRMDWENGGCMCFGPQSVFSLSKIDILRL